MKKILLLSFACISASWLSAQFIYKIKADSVLITNDSCTAELNLENSTKDTLGFLYNRGKGRTEFRRMVKKIDSVTYVIGGTDTIRTGGSSTGDYILNQYASKQTARAWIDTLKSIILISDTLRTKIIDVGGFGNFSAPDLNTGVWIRPRSDESGSPLFPYEGARPHLSVGHYQGNFGTDSIWQNTTPFLAYRTYINTDENRMSGSLYGWGKNNIYGNNIMRVGEFASGVLLDTSSTPYTFLGNALDFTSEAVHLRWGIGASKDINGTIKFNSGSSPPHGLRISADFNPYYTPTQQYDGFWYNVISHLRYGGGPNSYIDKYAHYYAQPFYKQTAYGHIKSGYGFYAGTLYQEGVDRPWGFYSEGASDRNYFAGQVLIGDTTVVNAGTNKLYVNGNSKITGSAELGDYLKLGNLSSDPTGSNGMLYYNSTNNKFRGYQNGAWTDLIGGGGSGLLTADNGLTANTSTNVRLGGTLVTPTSIDVGTSNPLTITGNIAGGSSGGLIVSATSGNAIYAASTTGRGVYSVASSNGLAIVGINTSTGTAIYGSNTGGGLIGNYELEHSSTNTIRTLFDYYRFTSGTAAAGLGQKHRYFLEVDNGSAAIGASLNVLSTNSGASTYASDIIWNASNAGAETNVFKLSGNGAARLYGYGDGTFVGTATKFLAVDADGNIIEENVPGGGGSGLGDPGSNGIVARTALNTTTARTLTGTTNEISISNGDGVSGNPTISLPSTLALASKSVTVQDNNFTVQDDGDNSKKFKFDATGIPASTTVTLTSPSVTSTLVSYKTTSEASNSAPAPTGDAKSNEHFITALGTNATVSAPSGTITNGNRLIIRIKDNGVARTLTWNSVYRAGTDIPLPTTTILSKTMYLGFIYNSTDSKWDLIAYINNL